MRARLGLGRFGNLALHQDFRRPLAVGMGAALRFPLEDAAVPVTDRQIDEVIFFCRSLFGREAAAYATLRETLDFNRAWVALLAARQAAHSEQRPGRSIALHLERAEQEVERLLRLRPERDRVLLHAPANLARTRVRL